MMRQLAFALLLCFNTASAEPPSIPQDWLAVLTVNNPPAVAQKVQTLLKKQQVPFAAVAAIANLPQQALQLDTGSLLLGVGAPEGDLDRAYAFAIVPTNLVALQTMLQGEIAGETLLATLPGYEIAARSMGDHTLIVPVDRQDLFESDSLTLFPSNRQADAALTLSSQGMQHLVHRAGDQTASQAGRRRIGLLQLGWLPNLRWIDAAIGKNEPLIHHLAESFTQVECQATLHPSGETTLRLQGALREPGAGTPPTSNLAASLGPLDQPFIGDLTGEVSDGSLGTLAQLLLAYGRGRPDEIESRGYDPDTYTNFLAIASEVVAQVQYVDAKLLTRRETGPFYSNRVALLQVQNEQAFLAAANQLAIAWNQVVAASQGSMPIRLESDSPKLSEQHPAATRFTADIGAAIESPTSPEVQAVMQQYYGPDGLYRICLQPLGEGRLLLADLPEKQLAEFLEHKLSVVAAASRPLSGVVHLDRYARWQNAMLDDYLKDALGFQANKSLGPAAIAMRFSQTAEHWSVTLQAEEESMAEILQFFLQP